MPKIGNLKVVFGPLSERERVKKCIAEIINSVTPFKQDAKKELLESYMLVYDSRQKEIDALKAQNPDVTCPACGGGIDNAYQGGAKACCHYCKHTGTLPLTKAQEYRIRELEEKLTEVMR